MTYHAGMAEPGTRRVSHESRLLIITIGVCVLVLLLLARLRFPEPDLVETAVQPLERLASGASYDSLAADIQRVEAMISPNLVVLRTTPRMEAMPRRIRDVLDPPGTSQDVRHVAALRVTAGIAVAAMPPGVRIDGIVGSAGTGGTAAVLGVDPVRRIARVRVPDAPARQLAPLALTALRTPVYVVAVEGTQAGVTLRPVFLGRGDRFSSARWSRPLLPLGGIALAPGALLFTLSGEFIGCVVIEDGAPAVAGSRDVLDVVERLATTPSPAPGTLGIAVQPLTTDLASALGVERGVIVSEIDGDGPAAGQLQPADVVTTVEDEAVASPDQLLLQVASRRAGDRVPLTVVRHRAPLKVAIVLAAAGSGARPADGLVEFQRPGGRETRVVAARTRRGVRAPGLVPGDVIVTAGELTDPDPLEVRRLLEKAGAAHGVVVTVRRGGEQHVVAVRVPEGDGSRD